ncbi:ATP-binding protein [Clostridium sp. OM07-10AC]|nr:ATP-binding protein [Clostridium sp. OM07-10AC]
MLGLYQIIVRKILIQRQRIHWNSIEKKYNSYVETPLVDVSEMDFYSTHEMVFPNKSQIFVPQSFRVLTYKNNIHLEDRKTWEMCDERDDIGKFVSDILRHSVIGSLPLLILGHPGAGKSLLCNMLAARILHHEYHVIIVKLVDCLEKCLIYGHIRRVAD